MFFLAWFITEVQIKVARKVQKWQKKTALTKVFRRAVRRISD